MSNNLERLTTVQHLPLYSVIKLWATTLGLKLLKQSQQWILQGESIKQFRYRLPDTQ